MKWLEDGQTPSNHSTTDFFNIQIIPFSAHVDVKVHHPVMQYKCVELVLYKCGIDIPSQRAPRPIFINHPYIFFLQNISKSLISLLLFRLVLSGVLFLLTNNITCYSLSFHRKMFKKLHHKTTTIHYTSGTFNFYLS